MYGNRSIIIVCFCSSGLRRISCRNREVPCLDDAEEETDLNETLSRPLAIDPLRILDPEEKNVVSLCAPDAFE